MLVTYLKQQGFTPFGVGDGKAMEQALSDANFDLILLDLMLPGEDGLSLTRRLRQHSRIPVIMLSARGDDIDRIVGLEVGADDYLAKPFNPRELLARIRAVLRRNLNQPESTSAATIIQFGPYRLDLGSHTLVRDDEPIPLTTAEFTLLRIFVQHPNKVLSRDQLTSLIQDEERMPFDRSIDTRVARLRRRIEPDSPEPVYIRTVWGAGYLFVPQGSEK